MKKVIITGATGTIGRHLSTHLKNAGVKVFPWDTRQIPFDDEIESELFLSRLKPDVLYHLGAITTLNGNQALAWQVNVDWPIRLAKLCLKHDIKLVFASSAQVFDIGSFGPFTIGSWTTATSGLGYMKRKAERQVLESYRAVMKALLN